MSTQTEFPIWTYLWRPFAGRDNSPNNIEDNSKSPTQSSIISSTDSISRKSRRFLHRKPAKLTTSKLDEQSQWICGLQLSMWDNISGPRVEQNWVVNEELKEDVQLYTARHTLCGILGQIETEQSASRIETKFHIYTEQGLLITSSLFSAPYCGTPSKFSLSLLVRLRHLQRYLVLYPVIMDRMDLLVNKLQALLEKSPEGCLSKFSHELNTFVHNLEGLFQSGLRSIPSIRDSLFYTAQNPNEIEFLARAVTSHLQTHGCTVVTGSELSSINAFIETLSLFLTPKERQRSSYCIPNQDYIPDLILQGLLVTASKWISHTPPLSTPNASLNKLPNSKLLSLNPTPLSVEPEAPTTPNTSAHSNNNSSNTASPQGIDATFHHVITNILNEKNVIQSLLPTTWVDLDQKQVRQTHQFHEYQVVRKEFNALEVKRVIGVDTTPQPGERSLWHERELFKLIRSPAPCVYHMLLEIFRLPPGLREGYVSHMQRLLYRRAVVLIKYVESELSSSDLIIKEDTVKKIKMDLGITVDADYALILGIAEKLKKGIFVMLAGDPTSIEERFIQLFEDF